MMQQCWGFDGYKPTGDNPHFALPRLPILQERETAQWRQLESYSKLKANRS
jgi:hypothetical protein